MEAREGVVGTGQITSYRWNVPEGRSSLFMPVAMTGDRVLALEPRPDLTSPVTDPLGAFVFVLASGARWRSTLWALGPEGPRNLGRSRLELECRPLPLAGRGACQIFDASRTRFFEMDAGTGAIRPVASLPGRFFVGDEPDGSWLTGWYQSGLVSVRLAPAAAVRVAGPDGARAHMLSASDHGWPPCGINSGRLPVCASNRSLRERALPSSAFTRSIRPRGLDRLCPIGSKVPRFQVRGSVRSSGLGSRFTGSRFTGSGLAIRGRTSTPPTADNPHRRTSTEAQTLNPRTEPGTWNPEPGTGKCLVSTKAHALYIRVIPTLSCLPLRFPRWIRARTRQR